MNNINENEFSYKNFDFIEISIASPDKIRSWSYGEIKKPETINYRTLKPEKDGLFCSRIFGPINDYECICGKYKKIKYKDMICEKCGVEIISSKSRRNRMGHIELVSPVCHIWFLRSLPSKISILLNISLKDIEKVIYFENYIITESFISNVKVGNIINEEDYILLNKKYFGKFVAKIGAEAIFDLLKKINLKKEYLLLIKKFNLENKLEKRNRIYKRMKIIKSFINSNNKPEWMILTVIPVLPPDLRPLVPLEGGRFATSDLNDLYRRIINRNNRLKRLIDLSAPNIIIKNEKRMLQESVDFLLDNGRRGKYVLNSNKKQLKSLSDMIKGKYGRFRQNLLGKRVDFSGRSVIIPGPNLKLNQCGIPKKIAIELFKPFIYGKLEYLKISSSIKMSKKILNKEDPIILDILEDIMKDHPILLNRAPTLHRLGIQSFDPVLINGESIQLHPLVCSAYNADFDGDQMAIHVPLTIESQLESRILMMSVNNILSPANGDPVIFPSQDMVLGIYYLTKVGNSTINKNIYDINEIEKFFNLNILGINDNIKVRITDYDNNKNEYKIIVNTTVGRCILWNVIPKFIPFYLINNTLNKSLILNIISYSYFNLNLKDTVILLNNLMKIGFKYATISGISIGLDDLIIPNEKDKIINDTNNEVNYINKQYELGLLTYNEKYNKIIDIWSEVSEVISKITIDKISDVKLDYNNIFMMIDSGARGSLAQIRQLSGIRGLMTKTDGYIIENPIKSNFKEGLNIIEYFISTHGARKGLSDTALKTANSGYLTRRLVDVAQDIVILLKDCKTNNGIKIELDNVNNDNYISLFKDRIIGRILSHDIYDNNKLLFSRNTLIDYKIFDIIIKLYINHIYIRSPITCELNNGICSLCYGIDLSKGNIVNIGESVGIIAAQSIGEPGTQLTMRTFHIGGAISIIGSSNIKFKNPGILKLFNCKFLKNSNNENVIISKNSEVGILNINLNKIIEKYKLPYGSILNKLENDLVDKNEIIASWDYGSIPIISEFKGKILFENIIENKNFINKIDEYTGIPCKIMISNYNNYDYKPYINIVDSNNNILKKYYIPEKSIIHINNFDNINLGDVIAITPQNINEIKDITGGLPKVSDIFEARKPKNSCLLAEETGFISFKIEKNKKKILIRNNNNVIIHENYINKNKNMIVFENDYVNKGDIISTGNISIHDILRIKGLDSLVNFIINEIQNVYKLQGVKINSKHIEIIIKQMLKIVIILDSGDSKLIKNSYIKLNYVRKINKKLIKNKKRVVVYKYSLIGITKSSLLTDSFISSASFQETTKILTNSAICSKIDFLKGLKENVILGRLIPAGTGYYYYNKNKKK
ncbi:DNA-directed RNA polymerase subunit beta' [endosymbiont of Rhynchophorus ferrugineus]|uniref:DNA-directed RNA polymerase subunit beta' n=1 Tax=endosymbiont of Rhynchophorus ferrugineus TaxID=1972133 RepID=A0A2Z5T944_9GAMM|nr:DNA-directed RNA polymerase subunit beta' [Candidatus Nardonella dryophthoridicola]BBA85086.1 DNA-directed RNA polymerase subunit beta' [endosymbiont of Rhynchophorus ferrugineus]